MQKNVIIISAILVFIITYSVQDYLNDNNKVWFFVIISGIVYSLAQYIFSGFKWYINYNFWFCILFLYF